MNIIKRMNLSTSGASTMAIAKALTLAAGIVVGVAVDQTTAQAATPAPVIEVVTLNLKSGVTPAQFKPVDHTVQTTYMEKRPGFISRESAPGSGGKWVVVVHWKSLDAAHASMKSFEAAPATAKWMALIDPKSMVMTDYHW